MTLPPADSEPSDAAWGVADPYTPSSVSPYDGAAAGATIDPAPTTPGDERLAPSDRPLLADSSFWAMNATQFLGAMNDNVFKFVLLFIFVSVPWGASTIDLQGLAIFVFSIPFVLFSGLAGYLSDKYPKRTVIVTCKIAEIGIMLVATLLFWRFSVGGYERPTLILMLAALFAMGIHSTMFGPGKYGILPELLRKRDLPQANSVIVTFTFLAIIFGAVAAGLFKQHLGGHLWAVGLVSVGIAVVGTCTAQFLRRPRASDPTLPFHWGALGIPREIRDLCRRDRELFKALAASSAFWFVASVAQPSVVALGDRQLYLGESLNSLLQGMISLGIVVGALAAGYLSKGRFEPRLMRAGLAGLLICVSLLALPRYSLFEVARPDEPPVATTDVNSTTDDSLVEANAPAARNLPAANHLLGFGGSLATLGVVGICTGMFAVPLTTLLQSRPPISLRGRTIATQNLLNWIGITFSGAFYQLVSLIFDRLNFPPSYHFAICGLFVLGILAFYHPSRVELNQPEPVAA